MLYRVMGVWWIGTNFVDRGEITFSAEAVKQDMEITGHPVLRVSMSISGEGDQKPEELDVFVTLRHLGPDGKEGMFKA